MRLYILVSFWTLILGIVFRLFALAMEHKVGENVVNVLLASAIAAWAAYLLWLA